MSGPVRVSPDWLALREPADAAARSAELVGLVRPYLPAGPLRVHDLGCGTGSMTRWLAPRLGVPQHWVLYDRDADLLARASRQVPPDVGVETRDRDITRLAAAELAGAQLVTASALLDMFTAEELERFVARVAGAGCPALLTLSVTGRVELTPADPLDERVREAFNSHQRRTTGGRRLLGPDAVTAAATAFAGYGSRVVVRASPWRLGAPEAELALEWFEGWLGAACERCPELVDATVEYRRIRLAQARAGVLGVTVHHSDLLVTGG
jgi:trans-aconitate methyltransferase